MKKTTTRIAAILIAIVMLIGCSVGIISASAFPNYDQGTVNSINEALSNYENKVKTGTIYTNMSAAYTAYVDLSRYLDRYYYGNENVNQTYINVAITTLNNAINNMQPWTGYGAATTANMSDGDLLFQQSTGSPWSRLRSYFNGVLWAQKNYDAGTDGGKVTAGVRGSVDETTVSYYLCYPIYVLLWDGNTKPTFGVLLEGDAQKDGKGGNNYRYFYGASILDSAANQGMSLERNWTAANCTTWGNTTRDFGWNLGIDSSITELTRSGSSLTGENKSLWLKNNAWNSKVSYHRSTSNMVTYNGPTGSGYVFNLYPAFRTYTGSKETPTGQGNWNGDIVLDVTGNQAIYVINYKALTDAMNTLSGKFSGIANYREGGLATAMAALDKATAYNYNTDFASVTEGQVASKVTEVSNNFASWVTDMTATAKTDQYSDLRAAINEARAKYFEDTTKNKGVGGTNPMSTDGINYKYCTPQWDAFAAAYAAVADKVANTSAFMSNAGEKGDYSQSSQAAVYASQLREKLAAVKEHVTGSEMKYRYPEQGGYRKATCEDEGLAVQYSACPNCSEDYINNNAYKITAAGHTYVPYEGENEATCTQPGVEPYFQCIREADTLNADGCGKYFKDNEGQVGEEIEAPEPSPALGHDFGDTPAQPAQDATCSHGSYKEIWYCNRCHLNFLDNDKNNAVRANGDDLGEQNDKKDHTFVEHDAVENNCEHPGNVHYWSCETCDTLFNSENAEDILTDDPTLPQLAHDFQNYEYQDDKTCINDGSEVGTCSMCGTTDTRYPEEYKAEGHKFEKEGAKTDRVLPTCVDSGNVEYYTCDVCEKNFNTNDKWSRVEVPANQLVIAPTGMHSFVTHNERNATCQEKGYATYYECSVCGGKFDTDQQSADDENFDEDHAIDEDTWFKDGVHTLIAHGARNATCLEKGYDPYWECAICQMKFDSDDQGDDLDQFAEDHEITNFDEWQKEGSHYIISMGGTPATCMEPGEDSHYECVYCNKWFTDADGQEETPELPPTSDVNPNNHVNVWATHEKQDATCEQAGWSQTVYECLGCGAFYSAHNEGATESTDKLGDSLEDLEDYYTEQLPHNTDGTPGEWTQILDSTCYYEGSQWRWLYCSICNEKQDVETGTIAMKDHIPTTGNDPIEQKDPKCNETGMKAHFECANCHQLFDAEDTDLKTPVPAQDLVIGVVDHDYGEVTTWTKVISAATCTTNAIVEGECKWCGTASEAKERTDGEYGKLGHNMTTHDEVKATCLGEGNPLYYSCDRCNQNYADNVEYTTNVYTGNTTTPATGHHFVLGAQGTPGTCEAEGTLTYYVCDNDNCEAGAGAKFLDPTDTTAEKGVDSIVDPQNPANHTSLKVVSAKAATCSPWKTGENAHIYCEGCKNYYATYDHYGEKALDYDKDIVTKPSHTLKHYDPQDPSCLEDGWTEAYVCQVCSEIFTEDTPGVEKGVPENTVIIPADGHNFDTYVPAVEGTCVTPAKAGHVECKDCHIKVICEESEVNSYYVLWYEGDDSDDIDGDIVPDNHVNTEKHEAVVATCTVAGVDAYTECKDCGKLFAEDGTETDLESVTHDINPNNHVNVVPVTGTAPKCGVPGVKDHFQCTDCQKYFLEEDCTTEADEENLEIPALEHSFTKYEILTPATCTDDEVQIAYCDNECGESAKKTIEGTATGHSFTEYKPYKDATCTDDAVEIAYCDNECGETEEKTLEGTATGHSFTDYKSNNNATCTDDGTETAECDHGCGATEERTEEGSATGHSFTVYKPYKDANCTEDAVEIAECDHGCGTTQERTVEDTATGHTPGEPREENRVEPTETKDGGYDLVVHCEVCGVILESTHVPLPATGSGSGEDPSEKPSETPSEQPSETPSEQPTEKPSDEPTTQAPTEEDTTKAPSEETTKAPTEDTTKAPGNGNGSGSNSGISPNTGLAITIPVFSLAALAGGFFSLGYARKKKNEDEE